MIGIGFRHEVSLLADHKREAYMMRYIQHQGTSLKICKWVLASRLFTEGAMIQKAEYGNRRAEQR